MSSLVVNDGTTLTGFDFEKLSDYNSDFDDSALVEHFNTNEVINLAKGIYDINDRKKLISVSRSPPKDIPKSNRTDIDYKIGSIHDKKKYYITPVDLDNVQQTFDNIQSVKGGGDLMFTMDEDIDHTGGFQHYFEVG
jgi:hypothetical protein